MTFTYELDTNDPSVEPTPRDFVRLLLNDVDENTAVFNDAEIAAFLMMEGGAPKLAAAQAIDTNADNEALASKVLRTQDLTTDGAKLADTLRKRAAGLRQQHFDDLEGDGSFELIEFHEHRPEHTNPFRNGWL